MQFQPDPQLYYRLFNELLVYLRQYQPPHPWQLVVIYPDRQTERINELHFTGLLQLPNLTRIYINELSPASSTSLPIKLLKLIIEPEATAPSLATELARQAQTAIPNINLRENLINLLETIIVYKLPQKSREEIAAMFNLSDLKQTRFYQEVFTEGRQEGIQAGIQAGIQEGIQEGIQAAQKRFIRSLAARDTSLAEIAQILDLSLAQVTEILAASDTDQN